MTEQSTTVEKACALLRQLGRFGSAGGRLVDITEATGLSRQTALRILGAFLSEGLVTTTPQRRYRIGPSAFVLGLSAPSPLEHLGPLIEVVRTLAQTTGDTAYLSMRQGDQVFYLAREDGAFPIRTHFVNVGDCRNMTETYGGLTILSALTETECDAILKRGNSDPSRHAAIRQVLARAARSGVVYGPHVVIDGISGMGMPVRIAGDAPCFAVSLSAIDARMTDARFDELSAALGTAVTAITALLADWQTGFDATTGGPVAGAGPGGA